MVRGPKSFNCELPQKNLFINFVNFKIVSLDSILYHQLFVNIFQNGKSSSPTKTDGGTSQMILPKKKQMQPPHVSAQDGVRSDLLKAIRDGKNIIFHNSTHVGQKI